MTRPNSSASDSAGFSLIEFMIAMLIGLIITAGVVQVLISSRETHRYTEGLTALQENGRFAIDILERNIRLAGFPLFRSMSGASPFSFDGTASLDNSTTKGDQVAIQFESDVACQGIAALGSAVMVHTFSVTPAGFLNCNGDDLVEGVDNMQIHYGVDTDNDGIANLYASATAINGGGYTGGTPGWPQVVSVRVALLINSLFPITQTATSVTHTLLATQITTNDRLLRRVFETTIPVRNRTQQSG